MALAPLQPSALRRPGLAPEVAFETTDDLEDLEGAPGQERATEALRLAIALRRHGYNAYVMGPPGAGKHELARRLLGRAAADAPTPSDWCYLNDFDDPRRPRALELPPGRGPELRQDVDRLVEELRAALPAAFEGRDYRARVHLLEKELEETRDAALEEVRKRAEAVSAALVRTPVGFGFAPMQGGEVLEPDRFRALPEEERARFPRDIGELQAILAEVLRSFGDLERRHRDRMKDLQQTVAREASAGPIDELRRRWADLPAVLAHLDAVQRDVVENVQDFLSGGEGGDGDVPAQMRRLLSQTPTLRRYGVNVLVEHAGHTGAPVVFEDLPSLANLVGHVEHHAHFGTLVTDFTLVRAGALHRANGGYLVLDARRLLSQPFAWEELKRTLRARELRIEPPERLIGLAGTSSLEPQPIPLDVKVVLVGERLVWALLSELDPDFPRLFKVVADLEDAVPRSAEADRDFARLVATLVRKDGLRPFDRGAVGAVLHEAARLAGDATRLSSEVSAVRDLLQESDQAAAADDRPRVGASHVRAAVAAQERRGDRIRERLREQLRRGVLVVESRGEVIGQVNGLSVLRLGRRTFGHPTRITARVRLGRGEVVDIEREVALGGPIHSKGVLVLAGYLGARYCADHPLALSATLVMEQSYGGVEGDSASSAELYALLSAISGLPVRQALAVTGAVDQLGRVLAVGGASEKVEGFFDLCRERGLTGAEGVLVPAANVPELALREDVLAAIAEGRFRLYGVETVDQGVELLTGWPAGAPDASGRWPEGTVGARVAARLAALAEAARAFAAGGKDGDR